jgi:UDP:flavonoid glycosyltransferase YjiC (YdhE family)
MFRRNRIVLSTYGSLGDLHPLIAVGLELRERGHDVVFATNFSHQERVTRHGFEFHAIRPHISPEDPAAVAYLMDLKRGPERMLRELLFPALRDMYADLRETCVGADLLFAGELVYAAPMLAEKTGIAWASFALAPLSFFSAYDPPVVPPYPWLAHFYRFGPAVGRLIARFGHAVTKSWIGPVLELRKELGLPEGPHPVFEGKFSPQLVVAMFSSLMATPQRDWPPNTVQTGFTFYDAASGALPTELEAFLEAGAPPVVFTLGSAAVHDPGAFFHESIETAARLGIRALVIAGDSPPTETPPPNVLVTGYAPYSATFARAAAIVHQGGIGTTAQALRAGKPMIVVPYGFDQPDNAARVRRLGVAETISRGKYNRTRVVAALQRILGDADYAQRAEVSAQQVRTENGARGACDALERLI